MKYALKIICLLGLLILTCTYLNAQPAEKKDADKYFGNEDYFSALSLYNDLLQSEPNNPEYNFKYGVCLFYTDSVKSSCLKYLFSASNQSQPIPLSVYYLARAYHLNYKFSEAIQYFEKYKAIAEKKDVELLNVDRYIRNCQNGIELMTQPVAMQIIERKKMNADFFLSSYHVATMSAQVYSLPDNFRSSIDKKKKDNLMMCLYNNQNTAVFSSYGTSGKTKKDLYKVIKFGKGKWSKSQSVSSTINTPEDEDYPFMFADGYILYFCSNGHNSMGGYDIFKSEWNDETETWSEPKNLGYPINSPFNDIIYTPADESETAYFASTRESSSGNIFVYKIRYPKELITTTVIKGKFEMIDQPETKRAQIIITDMVKNDLVGIYNTNSTTGNYIITLPPGGKYKFDIKVKGFKEQSVIIDVPPQNEKYTLRQFIRLKQELTAESIKIYNFFDKEIARSIPDNPPSDFFDKQNKSIGSEVYRDEAFLPGSFENPSIKSKRGKGKQTTLPTQKKLMIDSDNSFKLGDYPSALQGYYQLLFTNPKDPVINYRIGLCLMHIVPEKEKVIPYFKAAASSSSAPADIYYYLGRCYHYKMKFDSALANYENFKMISSPSEVEKFGINKLIENCKNGKIISSLKQQYEIINKKNIPAELTYISFPAQEYNGKILVVPDDMKSEMDIKNNFKSTLFLSKDNKQLYYSSYGTDGKTGKDIYKRIRLPSGEWSSPQYLAEINSAEDEDYVFVIPDSILYFSSKGFNSMGEYDVFHSLWNKSTKAWSTPQNLGLPVNSPYNDIYFIICKDGISGYFCSESEATEGQMKLNNINCLRK